MLTMKKSTSKGVCAWAAVALWMLVIFLLSAQVAEDSDQASGGIVQWVIGLFYWNFEDFPMLRQESLLSFWSALIRKGAHFTEYAVLAMLIANALRAYVLPGKLRWWIPVVGSILYGVTDEIHQYFVPGRACMLLDVGIDTCGAIFGMLCFAALCVMAAKRKRGITDDSECSL